MVIGIRHALTHLPPEDESILFPFLILAFRTFAVHFF